MSKLVVNLKRNVILKTRKGWYIAAAVIDDGTGEPIDDGSNTLNFHVTSYLPDPTHGTLYTVDLEEPIELEISIDSIATTQQIEE